ncbi:MAG: EAL domain-containing protein [Clostridia bacterium]|nr:EAL domain-containing protein [Clostridia bacterium]
MTGVYFDNYTYAGDMAVIAICAVIGILLFTSYVSRTRSFRMFENIIVSLVAAAAVNILYHTILRSGNTESHRMIYILRISYQALLFDIFFLFTLYITEVTGMAHRKARIVAIVSAALFVVIIGVDVIRTLSGTGFRIAEDGAVIHRTNIFMIGYILYVVMLAVLINRAGNHLYKRVIYGFYGTMAVSVVIRFAQLIHNRSSLTTMTFVFPVIAMLYFMHSTPYNVTLGSVDVSAMEEMVRNMHARKAPFIFLSLLLPEYDGEGKRLPEAIRAEVRKFAANYFRGCILFRIGNGHVVLIAPKRRNPDCEQRIENILKGFRQQYQRFHLTYKIVVGEFIDEISRKNEYASLIKSIERDMPENTVRRVGPDDIDHFNREEYILRELTDIYNKKDVDDPRVLAFCQPVYDLKTGEFDTAEALMRLQLKETGLVFPDQFIPIAENHGYIHVLTEIILHKTCREIRRLSEEGFKINRISVNVSVLELKDGEFCEDISQIIENNSVSGDKIAIELTESRSEADFMIMKKKIEELRRKGIQFYLDDFGTGYSNMERIMELPFDIIKFDRSLVIASGSDERSEKIVENLAHMFRDMDYSVLYEGVEDDTDEERCREMSAAFLQGYKYSRPVPIEQLRDFLPKAG